MRFHNGHISLRPGGGGEVKFDDNTVAGVRAIHLTGGVNEIPTMVVDLYLSDVTIEGEMVVEIPERTRVLLLKLGWTPPRGESMHPLGDDHEGGEHEHSGG